MLEVVFGLKKRNYAREYRNYKRVLFTMDAVALVMLVQSLNWKLNNRWGSRFELKPELFYQGQAEVSKWRDLNYFAEINPESEIAGQFKEFHRLLVNAQYEMKWEGRESVAEMFY